MRIGERVAYGPVFGTVQADGRQGRVIVMTDGGNEIEVYAHPIRTEKERALAWMSAITSSACLEVEPVVKSWEEPKAAEVGPVEVVNEWEPETALASSVTSRIIWPQ